jgi:hypothetical protein
MQNQISKQRYLETTKKKSLEIQSPSISLASIMDITQSKPITKLDLSSTFKSNSKSTQALHTTKAISSLKQFNPLTTYAPSFSQTPTNAQNPPSLLKTPQNSSIQEKRRNQYKSLISRLH